MKLLHFYVTKNDEKDFSKVEFDLKVSCMYFRVFKKFRVCTCIHDIDEFRVYTVTSLVHSSSALLASSLQCHNRSARVGVCACVIDCITVVRVRVLSSVYYSTLLVRVHYEASTECDVNFH